MLSRDKEGPRTRIVRFQSTKVVPTSTIIVNYYMRHFLTSMTIKVLTL